MNFLPRTAIVLAVVAFLGLGLRAPAQTPPVIFGKEFSADMLIATAQGTTIEQKIYSSDGKIRSQAMGDFPISVIVRPDQQKIYSIMDAQKMVTVMPYDPSKMGRQLSLATGHFDGKFESVGKAVLDGVNCTQYKYTSTDGKVFDMWVDEARQIPLKMAAEDQSFVMTIKNYAAGPQDPSLFEIPEGYQVMAMPAMPNMPGMPAMPPGQ